MSEILGWRCEDREFNRWLTDDGSDVESARLAGCRITPLVAAPPEVTVAQVEEMLDRYADGIAFGERGPNAAYDAETAAVRERLLTIVASRIPKDTA